PRTQEPMTLFIPILLRIDTRLYRYRIVSIVRFLVKTCGAEKGESHFQITSYSFSIKALPPPPRRRHPRQLVVVDERGAEVERGGGCEALAHARILSRADFEQQVPPGFEVLRGGGDEAVVDGEAGRAAVEGEARLLVADVRGQGGPLGFGDVRRV